MALEIDNPFWQFSLQVYATPGVAEECLEVQDKLGVDVNVLLYAAWLGATRGVVLEHADISVIDQAVADWSADVVRPLRAVRRRLKLMPEIADQSMQMMRKRVADAELSAEQIEQALLYRLAGAGTRSAAGSSAAASLNVSAILAARGGDAAAYPLRRLLYVAGRFKD